MPIVKWELRRQTRAGLQGEHCFVVLIHVFNAQHVQFYPDLPGLPVHVLQKALLGEAQKLGLSLVPVRENLRLADLSRAAISNISINFFNVFSTMSRNVIFV